MTWKILLALAAVWYVTRPRVKKKNPQPEGYIEPPQYWPEFPAEVNDGWSQPTSQASVAPGLEPDDEWTRATYYGADFVGPIPPGYVPGT